MHEKKGATREMACKESSKELSKKGYKLISKELGKCIWKKGSKQLAKNLRKKIARN